MRWLFFLLIALVPLHAKKKVSPPPLEEIQAHTPLRALYHSLDPTSILEHLAFYDLYPETEEGKKALHRAWELLCQGKLSVQAPTFHLPSFDLQAIVSLVTRQSFDPPVELDEQQLALIEKIARPLANRKLKGSKIWTKEELLALETEEIDLGRGLLIDQFNGEKNGIRQYEASLDLMALQVLARLKPGSTDEEKIREINRFIFQEMQFRFPPHSLHAKDIDVYTFLPSVLDSRQGVCLGVSILYLCIAERIDLPLEIVTPPGHIYLRYGDHLNIETTARGINLPSDVYLGINTRHLQTRNLREVIGLAFVNQASVAWGHEDPKTTLALYEKAKLYLPDDPLLKMFMAINYVYVGKKTEGKKLFQEIRNLTLDYAVSPETMPEDYLLGNVDAEGLQAIFATVDENRESILEKQKRLQKTLKKYPNFRAGLLQLAVTWLQLGRGSEALEVLERYHKIDTNNCIVEYYLSILCIERYDYNRAWQFFRGAEKLASERNHNPKALKEISMYLRRVCPPT